MGELCCGEVGESCRGGAERGFLVAGGDENVDGDVVVEVCEERGEDGGALGGVLYKVGSFVGDIEVAEENWKILGSYASRIYVAASEESRTRGAG